MAAKILPTVFVSSTFQDIWQARELVMRVLRENDRYPVDLARDDPRTVRVKALIDGELDASDFYICIVGHRYGSRVEDQLTAPSWTHYEFERFLAMEDRNGWHGRMMILEPKRPGPTYERYRAKAIKVYDAMGLPEEERARDEASQEFFRKVIQGGNIEAPDPELIDLDNPHMRISLARASRTAPAKFEEDHEIESAVLKFLLREAHVFARLHGQGPDLEEGAPAMEPAVVFSPSVVSRLTGPQNAICAVTTRLTKRNLDASEVAEALRDENLWNDEKRRELDVSGISDPSVDEILRIMADREFGAELMSTREAQISEIAKEVAYDESLRRTYLIKNIRDDGIAKKLLRDVWPALQKEIARRAGPDAGLFLIVACDLAPQILARFCQAPDASPFKADAAVLLTEDALFPQDRPPTAGQLERAPSR